MPRPPAEAAHGICLWCLCLGEVLGPLSPTAVAQSPCLLGLDLDSQPQSEEMDHWPCWGPSGTVGVMESPGTNLLLVHTTFILMHTHTDTHIYITHIHIHKYLNIYTHIYVHLYSQIYVYTHIYKHTYTHIYTYYTHKYMYIYTYTNTHTTHHINIYMMAFLCAL